MKTSDETVDLVVVEVAKPVEQITVPVEFKTISMGVNLINVANKNTRCKLCKTRGHTKGECPKKLV